MNGIINILKPAGISSNFCVGFIKKKFNCRKVGHLGTLDPDACGVLPICVGKSTKLFDLFLNKNKKYRAVFVFGKETDTLDSAGHITKLGIIPKFDNVQSIMDEFVGKISQIPPNYSAKKINGKKAYELSRNGQDVELNPKDITIYSFKLIKQLDKDKILIEVECSSGTYVRALVRDLAFRLGTVGYAGAIIRIQSGTFKLTNTQLINEVVTDDIISVDDVLADFESIEMKSDDIKKLYNGQKVYCDHIDTDSIVIRSNKKVFCICSIKNNIIKIKTNLKEEI